MQKQFYSISFIILLLSMLINRDINAQVITDMRCENLIRPNAIDNTAPHFSWKTEYNKTPVPQKFYEIQVSSDSLALCNGTADLWNSGKVKSSSSVMVPYGGKALSARSLYYWRVRVSNDKNKVSDWSSISRFGTGIFGDEVMQGSYIGLSTEAGDIKSPLLRKKFTVDKKGTAFLHVNSLGYHEAYINGRKVNGDVLSPAVSHLSKRSLIVTYDVTPYLKPGENELVLWLGIGWYKKTVLNTVYDGPLVKAQLDLLQGKEWSTLLTTDASWRGRQSGYTDTGTWQALRFGGEQVERSLVLTDLTMEALDLMKWYPVTEVNIPAHVASPEMTEPNRIQEMFSPKDVKQLGDSLWLVDMGKNLTGWFEIRLPNLPAGHKVSFEYTDYIKDGNFEDQAQKDVYIAAGKGEEMFCNKFNHHAFRYVRISNLKEKPDAKSMKAYLVHSDYRATSSFVCSDPDLNAIHDMIQYTMRCLTFGGYMVDCPHLERAGYGGDGNSSTESLQIMYNVSPLFTNWLQAWGDVMREGGSLPHVAPNTGGGGGPYWCGFIVMAPWRTYVNYGDPRLIEKYYDKMKQWLGYVEQYRVNGLLKRWPDTPYRDWYLGDWLAPAGVDSGNEASIDLVNNCFVSECFATMGKIADILGKPDESKAFAKQRDDLNKLIHRTFYNDETGIYATGSQLDMSYPMLVGATPPALYEKVKERLFTRTKENYNDHIACGLVGVPILTKWAIENKAADFVYSMLKKRDYPGYLYMIDNGATTTWEYWSGERSRIHNCYNGIGSWFYRAVGGIRTDEKKAGYQHVIIEPQIPDGVTWAKTSIESPYGQISVDWSLVPGKLNMKVSLPAGCEGTIILPANARGCKVNGRTLNELKPVEAGCGIHDLVVSLQ
jgi:alpha-L-rhamnosidase